MGLSGLFLKKKEEIDPLRLIGDIASASQNAELLFLVIDAFYYHDDGSFHYTMANLANTLNEYDKQEICVMYIYGKSISKYETGYDFIIKDGKLNPVIDIEEISDCESILLKFAYEYLLLNPNDIFWCGLDWYFTLDDIKLIRCREFDKYWPYNRPDWK